MPADPATLRLPADLVPGDGRFGSGPSKVRDEAVARLAATGHTYLGTSHRRDAVRSVVRRVREGLAALFALPDGYEVLLGTGGTRRLLGRGDGRADRAPQRAPQLRRVLVAVRGDHPRRAVPRRSGGPESPPGTHPDAYADPDVDVYALTHNETSTGVMTDIVRPDGADGLVLVDATSGAGGLRVDPAAFDVYYFSPQKAFGSEGGLWLALCSPAALSASGGSRPAGAGSRRRWSA